MDYAVNADHEPTITLIKSKLAVLNTEIKALTEKFSFQEWNILSMKKPKLIKKYNSKDYSTGEKGEAVAVNNDWWGQPSRGGWGGNYLPRDIAWWISISNYWLGGTMGYFYYIYNSPTKRDAAIYFVIDDWCRLKVNGKNVSVDWNGKNGYDALLPLIAGDNVIEIELNNGVGPGAMVFYGYDYDDHTVLFKSGDPGWGYTSKPVPDYRLITNKPNKPYDKESEKIVEEINEINELIMSTLPTKNDNIKYKDLNTQILLDQVNELKKTYEKLLEDLNKPIQLEGTYQVSKIQTASNYSRYILYLLFAIFIVGSLIYIFKNPEVGNLDMFIMVLAIIIFIYYIHEFIQYVRRS